MTDAMRSGAAPAPAVRYSSLDALNQLPLRRLDPWVERQLARPRGRRNLILLLNAITVLRGLMAATVLAPGLYAALNADLSGWAQLATATALLVVVVLLYYSDSLDGSAARRWHLITRFGKMVDPAADKLLTWSVVVPLWLAAERVATAWAERCQALFVLFIAFEVGIVVVTFLEDVCGRKPQAGPAGKWKMTAQFVFVFLMYVGVWLAAAGLAEAGDAVLAVCAWFVVLAGSLAVISLVLHLRNLFRRR